MRAAPSEIALSAGVLLLGIGAALVTAQLPSEGGYAHIGPNFFPAVVSAGLILLGLWLFAEALRGGWRHRAEPVAGEQPFRTGAFAWVSAGLFIHMAAIGFALSLVVHLFFVKFLNVSLPGGWLAPLLGTAGI